MLILGFAAQPTNGFLKPLSRVGWAKSQAIIPLIRFGARDYDPQIGRWIIKDPIGLAAGTNVFIYVNNDPVNFIDPEGLCPVTEESDHYDYSEPPDDGIEPIHPECSLPALRLFCGASGFKGNSSHNAKQHDKSENKTTKDHKRQNKQAKDAIKEVERKLKRKLTEGEADIVHDWISHQGFGYKEILDELLSLFR